MKPQIDDDQLASAVMQECLSSELALFETHSAQLVCAVIASPPIDIRQVFEVMPHETAHEIENITCRLEAVESALESWKSSLIDLGKMGRRPATRQVRGVADQLKKFGEGVFTGVAERIDPETKYPDLHSAGTSANRAASEMSNWLRSSFLPETKDDDGVGLEVYSAWVRHYTGADIDERIKFCDARLAPEGSAAAPYYQPPSEDLSRPGTTWFPTQGKNVFNWWRIPTMWYHEAVSGHHLQIATVIIEKDRLSRFQRTDAWTSGHGEGWAISLLKHGARFALW